MGLKDRIPRRGTLGRKAMNAAMWSLVQIVAANMLRLMSNLIMTRILAPDAFGLMAVDKAMTADTFGGALKYPDQRLA